MYRDLHLARTLNLAAAVLMCGLLIVGCSGDDDDDPTDPGAGMPPAEMFGTWTLQSVTVNGAAADLRAVLEWRMATVAARMTVYDNSAYVYEEIDAQGGQIWAESGWLYVDGDEMDINTLQDTDGPVDETTPVTFTLTETEMTIRENDEGIIIVITMTK